LGAFDTVYHHELTVALPRQRAAAPELRIHATRSMLYGLVFAAMAWLQFHGTWVWPIVLVVLTEIGLTLRDFVVEDATRRLPASERITHTILAINGGALFGFYGWQLWQWHALPTSIALAPAGILQWVLSVFAIGVFASGIRDGMAARDLAHTVDVRNAFTRLPFQRVLITGGTGFIGSALVHDLLDAGHAVTVLSRDTGKAAQQFGGRARCVARLDDIDAADPFDVVVNLAGAPIVGAPWSKKRKALLRQSRIGTTQALGAWLARTQHIPAVWIQASAIGYYGSRPAAEQLDETSTAGTGFATELCREWEAAARYALRPGVRQVTLRLGVVFGPGGALPQLLRPIQFGMGGRLGDGTQIMSWIHRADLLDIMAQAMEDGSMQGVYNATAPQPLSQAEFAATAGKVLRRPVWFPIPAAPMRWLLGEMAELFFDGQRVLPTRLLRAGYLFRYPDVSSALRAEITYQA
jgi:uncharacterized protein (TIGR01777 family)